MSYSKYHRTLFIQMYCFFLHLFKNSGHTIGSKAKSIYFYTFAVCTFPMYDFDSHFSAARHCCKGPCHCSLFKMTATTLLWALWMSIKINSCPKWNFCSTDATVHSFHAVHLSFEPAFKIAYGYGVYATNKVKSPRTACTICLKPVQLSLDNWQSVQLRLSLS